MLITNEGTIIRTNVSCINTYSRTATGVIIMRLSEGSFINNVARLEKSEEIEEESKKIDKEIEAEAKGTPEKEAPTEEQEENYSENEEEIY